MKPEFRRVLEAVTSRLVSWGSSRVSREMRTPEIDGVDRLGMLATCLMSAAVCVIKVTGGSQEQAREILDLMWDANDVEVARMQKGGDA